MKFCTGLVSLLVAPAVASMKEINLVDTPLTTGSDIGKNLLSKARSLENNNNNNYYTWITNYSIKFDGCASIPQFEREEGIRSTLLAKFKLCPSDKCNSCPHAGEYIVEMKEFVEAYREAQMEAHEYECETQKETCEYQCENGYYQYQNAGDDAVDDGYNNNNNNNNQNNNNNNNNENDDEYCEYQCMQDAGMSYCEEDEQENLRDIGECRMMNEDNNNNNNNNYNANYNTEYYYVGAYCTSSGIYAGVFTDSACTKKAPKGTYEKYNYGYSLPTKPLVPSGCLECKVTYNNNDDGNNNNNNNNNQNDYNNNGILESCEKLYEQAGKCEKKLKDSSYPDTSACEMIHSVVPRLNRAFKTLSGPDLSLVFAWVFGIALAFMCGYVYLLHNKIMRQNVNLNAAQL